MLSLLESGSKPISTGKTKAKRLIPINFIHWRSIERFDRRGILPYTSVFVREEFSLSGAAPICAESLSWKGFIFGPGTK